MLVPVQSKTKPGTQKLSEVARLVVAPDGITATGWPAVAALCNQKLGIEFDGWQDGAGRLILAKRADGKLAAMIGGVGISIPRQVGKTYLIAAIVFALCILRPGLLVIWSAHHARTHEETFLGMQAFADRVKIKPYIADVFKGSGDEEVRFRNGSRILFGARERGFGRGIPGVDLIVSDEAQIMSEKAVDAQLATMNTSAFGLAINVGTPPRPEDPSEAFTRMRSEAIDGVLVDAVWIEIGADPDADPDDRKQWAKANPSWPHRTPTESILRLRRKLSLESFRREGLGIWDARTADPWGVVKRLTWKSRLSTDEDANDPGWLTGTVTLAVEMDRDQTRTTIAVAGARPDRIGAGLVAVGAGSEWVVETLTAMCLPEDGTKPVAHVVIDEASAASSLTASLEAAGLTVTTPKTADVKTATATLVNLFTEDGIEIRPSDELERAAAGAKLRKHGEGRVIDRWTQADASPLIGVNLAVWGHLNQPSTQPGFAMILGGS